jgi:hypothetical protein
LEITDRKSFITLGSGHGIMTYSSGERYDGNWDNNERNGYGMLFSANGNLLFSENWKNDEMTN